MRFTRMGSTDADEALSESTRLTDPNDEKTMDSKAPSKPLGPTGDFTGDIKVSQSVPTRKELEKAGNLPVFDKDGKKRTFKSLYAGNKDSKPKRVLVLFIRHFFCGNCQEYLRTLSTSITPSELSTLPVETSVIIIGCGGPSLIPFYAETTACPYPIYADPSKKLFAVLGMTRTLSLGQQRPSYMQKSLLNVMTQSIFQGFANIRNIGAGGDYWQVGGEFIFDVPSSKGDDEEVTWCHRMVNTRDHAEVPDIRKHLGLDETAEVPIRKRWSRSLSRGLSNSVKRQSWSGGSRSRGTSQDVTPIANGSSDNYPSTHANGDVNLKSNKRRSWAPGITSRSLNWERGSHDRGRMEKVAEAEDTHTAPNRPNGKTAQNQLRGSGEVDALELERKLSGLVIANGEAESLEQHAEKVADEVATVSDRAAGGVGESEANHAGNGAANGFASGILNKIPDKGAENEITNNDANGNSTNIADKVAENGTANGHASGSFNGTTTKTAENAIATGTANGTT